MSTVVAPKMVLQVDRYTGRVETVALWEWLGSDLKASVEADYEMVEGEDGLYGMNGVRTYNSEEDMFIEIY